MQCCTNSPYWNWSRSYSTGSGLATTFGMIVLLFLLFLGPQYSTGEPPTKDPIKAYPIRESSATVTTTLGRGPSPSNSAFIQPCNRSREIIRNSSWGRISDGGTNYTQDTTCEWLITAPTGHWISLKMDKVRTECSYDYLFILDGLSYASGQSHLLASFSGASDPFVTILAESGNLLIKLYSDPNYVLQGFEAEYSISPCPLNCSNAGECIQIQSMKWICRCQNSRSEFACQSIGVPSSSSNDSSMVLKSEESVRHNIEDEDQHSRVLLASSLNYPLARVGHSVIRLEDRLFIYGGFDLNTILDNLITFDLRSDNVKHLGNWSQFQESGWPSGRFGHSSVRYKHGFYVQGGKNFEGEVISDLLYYNATTGRWTEHYGAFPKLMYHSMTSTPSGYIYVFGGGTPSGEFSSKLYKFHESFPTNWTEVNSTCCGKSIHRSVLGHTLSYWPQKNALILFGGVGSSDFGRFSKLSSQLWIFLLNSSTWLQLEYKRNGGVPMGIYPERAFHTAHVVDHYLTIFGGYTHVHNRDETCYSNQMLVYNLECQIFLPIAPAASSSSFNEVTQGLFGHQSTIFKDELLIIGGYRGYLSQGVRKIPFPFTKSHSSDCLSFDRWRCSGEAKCGWCPTNSKCFDKVTGASNCTTNLQTVQCPGICPLLSSCQSCVIPGCIWCGALEQCWKESEESRTCNNPLDNSPQSSPLQCAIKSFRMGATQFEYRFPPNFSNPDGVKIVNSSILIIPREYGSSIPVDNPVTFRLRGSLVGISFTHPFKKLELCALQAAVNLTLSSPEEALNSTYKWTEYQLCHNLSWPTGSPVFLLPGLKINFDIIATSFGKGITQEKSGRVTIQLKYYSGPISSPRVLRKDHLIPFQSDQADDSTHLCLSYSSCLVCTGDASCVWKKNGSQCISRLLLSGSTSSNSVEAVEVDSLMGLLNESVIIQPEDCPLCSDNNFCSDCVSNPFGLDCEWWEEEMSCQRTGRLVGAIRRQSECPSPCNTRKNCTSCLDAAGKCVWCATRQECFVFSVYTSTYNYGQCFQWFDKPEACSVCDKQPTCESCILNIGCGWSYNENGGSCSEGDFSGPYRNPQLLVGGDSTVVTQELQQGGSNKTWTYGECPDANECDLSIDNCHPNATCMNTPGSFNCICKQGFTGDGREACDQTCYEPCIHGTCTSLFTCECDLGWSGVSCAIDCGCNNHSFCETGKCDECRMQTTGEHCELCADGSYGNATLAHVGCSMCNCNGHGDESLGLCHNVNGDCFCLDNTAGKECSECAEGFYGDPTDGRPCYHNCGGRRTLNGPKGYFGIPSELTTSFVPRRQLLSRNSSLGLVEHCMWIIKANNNESTPDPPGIRITIEPGMDIPCSHNALLIYKGYSDYGVNGKTVPLVAAVCNEKEDVSGNKRRSIIHVTVEGNVATIVLKYARMGSTKFSYSGSFKVLDQEDMERSATIPLQSTSLPFNVSRLYEGPSLSVLSRYGHSLHAHQQNLWVFGGYSLSHGPLNDIRHFSLESNSWVPLTITVLQNDEATPPARYFHSGVIEPDMVIFIHGGISINVTFLADSWKFDTRTSRWSKFCEGPNESPKLAGHSLTLRPKSDALGDTFNIIMIGGFNTEEGFSDKVYSISDKDCWTEVETIGSTPIGLYGHSTIYHEQTDTFYVFGGILHDTIGLNHVSISKSSRLFVLHWPTKRWSVLMEENQAGSLPNSRFLHTAVTTDSYMAVFGGLSGASQDKNATVLVYVYQCNLWLDLYENLNMESGEEIDIGRVASASEISNNEIFQMGGWNEGSTTESLFRFSLPKDPCAFQREKERCKRTIGCAYCSSNNNQTQQCYNSEMEMPNSCSSGASNIEFWKGVTCSFNWLTQQSCGRFTSCTNCLATWPSHPNITQECQWCTNGKEGRCVLKKVDEESPCGNKEVKITDSQMCPERLCSAPQCEKCIESVGKSGCIWTRQIQRNRERSWELRLQPVYDWNCVRKSILDQSPGLTVSSSPPGSCPILCQDFFSCQECLESPGAEGGFHQCYWSLSQGRCISPAYSPLICFGGMCGPILRGSPAVCPKSCTTLRSCATCLLNPSCGWCAVEGENGEGSCLPANSIADTELCSNRSKWHYLKCPMENECQNGHHNCNQKSEECIDLEKGYECKCRVGYESSETSCIPICSEGCVHGICVEPNKCSCNFGYVGTNCSAQCDCNGHSECAGIDKLDICLECKNNTMGPKCSQCKPMYVGDPKNSGSCVACIDYCNGHSSICLSYENYNKWCNGTNKHLTSSQLMSRILSSGLEVGPSTQAYCCSCNNNTSSETCNDCIPGHFRGYDDKRLPCRKCECNGHGDQCNSVTGHECNCQNSTESEACGLNVLKQNPHYQCWKYQCSKCKESYLGIPTNGHQCYIQMHVDSYYCFDPKSQDQSCVMKQKPLLSGRTVFFAVQPKFMNVNIRVTLDVTHGSINVYVSPKDDTFVIKQDEHNWIHRVEFDTKYGLAGDKKDFYQKTTAFSGESNKIDSDYEFPLNKTDDLEEGGVNRVIPKPIGSSSAYKFIEHEAAGFATYYTSYDPKAILLVRNLRNRLVITLPQDSHDLRLTRFYLVLEGIGDVSFGSVFFRQDQLHIDLFVFFSVFFSAFFLFLAGCGVAWKVKQNMESRRARHRHVAEMLSMAKRPFAMWTILLEPDASSGIAEAYTQCRKSCRKGCICLRPLAVEWTSGGSTSNAVCTMLISMPGGSCAPVKLCIGSVLANLQRSSHPPYHARRRRL